MAPQISTRWGVQTGLFQPRQPAFWLFLLALAAGAVFGLQTQLAALRISPAGLAASWLLLGLYIAPVAVAVRWLDGYEPEPRSLVAGAFLWGAVVVPLIASFGNEALGTSLARLFGAGFASRWSDALTAAPVEEAAKVVGMVLLFLIARAEFDDLLDGFVYGSIVGLGFAVAEDVFYFMFKFGGSLPAVFEGFFVRVIASGFYTHIVFSGIAGIGFVYLVRQRTGVRMHRRLIVAGALLTLAVLAHFIWNSPWFNTLPLLLLTAFKGAPFLLALVILVRLARQREDDALATILDSEVGRPGLLPREMEFLRTRGRRGDAATRVRAAGGDHAERLFRQLQREQIKLALVATAVKSADDAELIRQRESCRSIRRQLWAIDGVTAALALPPDVVAAELNERA